MSPTRILHTVPGRAQHNTMSINYYLCWFALPILLTSCASAYLTGLLCRFAQRRHWRARLYFGFIGALGAGTLAVLFIWLGLSISPGEIGKFDVCLRSRPSISCSAALPEKVWVLT